MAPIVLYSEESGLGGGDADVSLHGTGRAVPRGVETLFQYNGLILNDRSVIDKYRIISIDGLDDADIRDSRDENPADDGETPNSAFYGGRTIAINGRVEAYELNKLRDMIQALRTAFADITQERQLHFLTGNGETDHYINCKKFSRNQIGEEQKHLNHFFRDFTITLRASDPCFYRKRKKSYSVYPNKLINPSFETGDETGWIGGGTGWTVTTVDPTTDWSSDGDYSEEIHVTKDNNTTSRTYILLTGGVGTPEVIVGEEYEGSFDLNVLDVPSGGIRMGIYWYTSGDVLIGTPDYTTYNTSTGTYTFTKTATAPATAHHAVFGIEFVSNVALDVAHLYIDNAWFGLVGTQSQFGAVEVTNAGNYKTRPLFRIYGETTAPSLINATTEEEFTLKDTVTIADGDFYEVDVRAKTIKNAAGVNKIADLDPASDWLKIIPGTNYLQLRNSTTGESSNSQFDIELRDAWV